MLLVKKHVKGIVNTKGIISAKGTISVEACVTVLLFMFVMFIFLGFFQMFAARYAVSHAVMETAQSLALDAWQISKLQTDSGFPSKFSDVLTVFTANHILSSNKNPYFSTDAFFWKKSSSVVHAVEERFLGYFTGGNETAAANYIKAFNIENPQRTAWLTAFDFSESKVVNGDLYVVVSYRLNYMFKIWGLDNGVDVKQTAVSFLWANDAETFNSK